MDLKDLSPNSDWLKSPRKGGSLRRRTFSFFLDLFCVLLTTKLLMASYISYLRTFMFMMGEKSQALLTTQMHKVEFSVITVVFFGYFFLSYYMGAGKTPGKILFRLRVVPNRNETELLTFKESIKRTSAYLFCYLTGFVLFAIPYFNKNKEGLPDMFSDSKVMTEEAYQAMLKSAKEENQIDTTAGEQLELDFTPVVVAPENIIYLPGPEFYKDQVIEDDDEDKAA